MKKRKTRLKTFIFSFLCFIQSHSTANIRQMACNVVGIRDGDTLTCLAENRTHTVRLLHIDAPEYRQPFGSRAKQALSQLAFKQRVNLQVSGYDKYGRLLAVVENHRRENLNLKMIQLGMAWHYRHAPKVYQQAQRQAQAAKIGLWQDKNPMNPADWRANKR